MDRQEAALIIMGVPLRQLLMAVQQLTPFNQEICIGVFSIGPMASTEKTPMVIK